MESQKEEGNGYVRVSGLKGIWTLDEVIDLLHQAGLKVRIVMASTMAKEDDRDSEREKASNLAIEKEVR